MLYREDEIREALKSFAGDAAFPAMMRETGERIVFTLEIAEELNDKVSSERIKEINLQCINPLLEKNYQESLSNPVKAVEIFGQEKGRFVSVFHHRAFKLYTSAFHGFHEKIRQFADHWLSAAVAGEAGFQEAVTDCWQKIDPAVVELNFRLAMDPERSFLTDTAIAITPDDPSGMYRYGVRITDNNMKTAEFVNALSSDEANLIAETMVDAYIEGFTEDGKDYSSKNTVGLIIQAGYERIVPLLIKGFEAHGLRAFIQGVEGTKLNRQADYDHRFDYSLYLNEDRVEKQLQATEKAYENMKDLMAGYSGIAYLEVFGEKPFSPVPKPEACKADEKTSAVYNNLMQRSAILRNKYMPREQTSFEIIAFPSPEIEGDFQEIFNDTVKVNTLSNKVYRPIQQTIVDALDGAEFARVKGGGTNETDLTVSLCPLQNPEKETAFINCLASVNIPLGEVFTSPKLKGTTGMLHVEEAFLNGLRYDNIRLSFKDGYVDSWSCDNFDDPQKGKDYIHENLFFPHKTLPLGEFAIGTNTLVYQMALKHKIMGLLPVLILEKMGPHFAVGDTCFSWEEDSQRPSPVTGKTMVAVDNEHTIQRKEDPSKAYTNKHTDVTLPYSSLDSISAVHPDGREVFIIKDGMFALPGTELLNEAIEEAHSYI